MGSGTRTGRSWWRRTRHLALKGKTLNDMLVINLYLLKDRLTFLTIIFSCWKMFDQVPGALLLISSDGVTPHTGVFRIAHLSFLPTNACSTEDKISQLHCTFRWPWLQGNLIIIRDLNETLGKLWPLIKLDSERQKKGLNCQIFNTPCNA